MVSIDFDTVEREVIIHKNNQEIRLTREEAKEVSQLIQLIEDKL